METPTGLPPLPDRLSTDPASPHYDAACSSTRSASASTTGNGRTSRSTASARDGSGPRGQDTRPQGRPLLLKLKAGSRRSIAEMPGPDHVDPMRPVPPRRRWWAGPLRVTAPADTVPKGQADSPAGQSVAGAVGPWSASPSSSRWGCSRSRRWPRRRGDRDSGRLPVFFGGRAGDGSSRAVERARGGPTSATALILAGLVSTLLGPRLQVAQPAASRRCLP